MVENIQMLVDFKQSFFGRCNFLT